MSDTNNDFSVTCPVCGAVYQEPVTVCVACGYNFNVNAEEQKQKITCANCGMEVAENNKFCPNCGINLQEQNNEPEKTNEITCPNCGTICSNNDTFCAECGEKLIVQNNNSNNQVLVNQSANIQTSSNATVQNNDNSSDMVTCKYCGSKVNRYSKKCPNCGEWIGGVSHFGCGCFVMILFIIAAIIFIAMGNEFNIPFVGNVAGGSLIFFAFLYFLPSLIAEWRGHDSKFLIFVVNFFFGWTVLGWFVVLILSFTGKRR